MDLHHTPQTDLKLRPAERAASVAAGISLLFHSAMRKGSMWSLLGGAYLVYRGIDGHCPISAMAESIFKKSMNINIRTSLQINRPVEDVYAFWRKLDNLPLFMEHIESVDVKSGTASEWKAKLPGVPGHITWNAVIVNEKTNEVLGWSSVKNSTIYNAGKVVFQPMDSERCEIDVTITYRAPMGSVGENLARIFTPSFEKVVRDDIQNFKLYMENGFTEKVHGDFKNELI